jgi:hypothetical protein
MGVFDGAYQETPGMLIKETQVCTVRGVCYSYAADQGSNNRAEFYDLWLIMKGATGRGLTNYRFLKIQSSLWTGQMACVKLRIWF